MKAICLLLPSLALLSACATQDLAAEEQNFREQIAEQSAAGGSTATDITVKRVDPDHMTGTALLLNPNFPGGQVTVACTASRTSGEDYDFECKPAE